jgi:pilus assembly protein CpaC
MTYKFLLGALCAGLLSLSALAQQPADITAPPVAGKSAPAGRPARAKMASDLQTAQTLNLPLNKSQVVSIDQPIGTIAVGNPEIADTVVLTRHSFYVLGKKAGTTNVAIYAQGGKQLLTMVDVTVGTDIEGIKGALYDLLPHETVNVRPVNDGVSLNGTLSSPSKVAQAVEVAKRFVPSGHVINDLRVTGAQQVMLQVKVAEMQRSVSKNLSFKPFVSPTSGNLANSGFAFSTLDPIKLSQFAVAAGQVVSGPFTITMFIDALEERGAVKVLAEPNLIAMSGDTASFLAGGEFPVPVAQTFSGAGSVPTITVVFKPFGISLSFTPTVIDGDLINLAVAPEVSQLDQANSVTIQNFVIPGISTRRAKTTVELRDGQSFAIAGLLSSNFKDQMRGVTGLMDIPVLGALMRSTEYQRDETELVIIVTPRLVQPATPTALLAPTDSFVPPSEAELFLLGRSEGASEGVIPASGSGGLSGKYGHIIR